MLEAVARVLVRHAPFPNVVRDVTRCCQPLRQHLVAQVNPFWHRRRNKVAPSASKVVWEPSGQERAAAHGGRWTVGGVAVGAVEGGRCGGRWAVRGGWEGRGTCQSNDKWVRRLVLSGIVGTIVPCCAML